MPASQWSMSLQVPFWRNIIHWHVLKKTIKAFDQTWPFFVRHLLPSKPSRCRRPIRSSIKVLGVEFAPIGLVDSAPEKMQNLISIMWQFIGEKFRHVITLQAIVGSWNWFMILSCLAYSILQRTYEWRSGGLNVVKDTVEAKYGLRMLIDFWPLLFAKIARSEANLNL